MIKTYKPFKSAPKSVQLMSSFRNDDRCYEVAAVTGNDHGSVLDKTKEVWQSLDTDKVTDYDVAFDNVLGVWVGVVCIDR